MYAHTPPNFGDLLDRLKVQIERNNMTIKKKMSSKVHTGTVRCQFGKYGLYKV